MDKTLKLHSNEEAVALYGSLDENLRFAEKEYRVKISARNNRLKINGAKKNVEDAYRFFMQRLEEAREGQRPAAPKKAVQKEKAQKSGFQGKVNFFHKGKVIRARSKNQEEYLNGIYSNDVVISIGPAGTGKTYLAMACAIDNLKKKKVNKIILARPAVEAGENLGFLPGDYSAKIDPYLRPLYDALYDMMDEDEVVRALERGMVEVAPLAFMRGRTLNNSFIILDEAQNTTHAQMKMFLTRIG